MYLPFFLKRYRVYALFLLVILLAAFLRFHNLPQVYVFNFDEEYQATYAWTEVLHFHRIWIGVSASFLDFYLGPYFTYFTALLLKLSKGDPLLPAYFAASLGVLTTATFFFTGWKIFNLTTGFVSSLLYGSLPLFVYFDQKYWNVMFVPLTMLGFFVMLKMIAKSKWWWFAFPFLVGFILETDLAAAPLVLVGLYYFIRSKVWKDKILLLASIVIFLLMYWPLIIFDVNHNFSNLTLPFRLKEAITQNKNKNVQFDPWAKFKGSFDSLGRVWYLKAGAPNADEINFGCTMLSFPYGARINIDKYTKRTYAPFWFSFLSLSLLIWFIRFSFTSQNKDIRILRILLLTSIIFYFSYPGGTFEYYLLGVLTLFIFLPGIFISYLKGNFKNVGIIILIIPIFLGVYTIFKTSDEFSLGPKKILISKLMQKIEGNSFELKGEGFCHDYEGWRYLFKIYGRVPSQSYTDKNLGWLYPSEINKTPPEYTLILSEDRIPLKEDLSNLPSIKEGGYRAYIRKNF